MKTILLATNLGPTSRDALERALLIARSHWADLHVLHVTGGDASPDAGDVEMQVKEAIGRLQFELEDDFGSGFVPASVRKATGEPAGTIASTAAALGAELIVAGISEKPAAGRGLDGTILERLLLECDAPLLVVRKKPVCGYENVLVALDMSPTSRRALETALKVAPTAHFVVVHALEGAAGDEAVRGRINRITRDCFRAAGQAVGVHHGAVDIHFDEGPVAKAVARRADRHAPHLVVFGRHNRGAAGGPYLGSGARGILEALDADMLVTAAG